MRILSANYRNLKGRTLNSSVPFFRYRNGEREPTHTIILGENGAGKSTLLEALSLASFIPKMGGQGDADGMNDPDNALISLEIKLGEGLPDTEHVAGTVHFYAPAKEAGALTSTLTAGKELEAWQYYSSNPALIKKMVELSKANHPLFDEAMEEDGDDDYWRKAFAINRDTDRSKLLYQLDAGELQADDECFLRIPTLIYCNTDMNSFGLGLNVSESPKNLSSDLGKVIHCRLPATDKDGRIRAIEHIQDAWSAIFSIAPQDGDTHSDGAFTTTTGFGPTKNTVCDDDGTAQLSMHRRGESGAHDSIDFLSSGENEAFMICLTVISCNLRNSVIVLDEPELHLSPSSERRFYNVLSWVMRRHNMQCILATHSAISPAFALSSILHNGITDDVPKLVMEEHLEKHPGMWMANIVHLQRGKNGDVLVSEYPASELVHLYLVEIERSFKRGQELEERLKKDEVENPKPKTDARDGSPDEGETDA